jgi:hypothetical protein
MGRKLAIEINDAGLVAADETGVVLAEPGYAVVDGREILTGAEAYATARLKPRDTSHTHWARLSIEPGSAAVPGKRSTAELAFAQLQSIWRRVGDDVDHVVFVVPGTLEGEALGILLGLAEECGMPAGAIVDAAAAASLQPWPGRQLVYVDADLHSAFVTPLAQADRVTAETPVRLESMGLAALMDSFARRMGELFVLSTRFDPFHRASTEQRVYDGLADVLAELDRSGTATFALARGDESFEIEIEASQVLGAAQGFYRALRQLVAQNRRGPPALVVQLSHRLAMLPGLAAELKRLDAATIVEYQPGHAAIGVLESADALGLEKESVTLFRHLPWRREPELEPRAAAHAPTAVEDGYVRPTHVVYRGVAYPVNGEGVVVGRTKLDHRRAIVVEAETQGVSRAHCEISVVDGELRLRDLSSYGTFVNERRIQGDEVLKPADVIRVGSPGAELIAVRVEGGDGA